MRISIRVVLLLSVLSVGYANADSPPPADPNAPAAADNTVHSPGVYSYQAPSGWKIKEGLMNGTVTSAGDMVAEHDAIALLSITVEQKDVSLKKFYQDILDMEKKVFVTAQFGELQPFTTTSGWEGYRVVETRMNNSAISSQIICYFFAGHGDAKLYVMASCHGDAIDHYTPLFDAAMMSLVRE